MKVDPSAETAPGRAGAADRSLALAGVTAGALAVAFVASPATISDGPVICPFRLMTGLPCPGCGLTRSWVHLAHGQMSDAWAANPFGVVTMALALTYVVAVGWAWVTGRAFPDIGRIVRSKAFLILGVGWIAFGVVRLITVAT